MMQRRTFLKLSAVTTGALLTGAIPVLAADPTPFPVYLTFDGGPSSKADGTGLTFDVLKVLKKYKVPATFFVSGHNLHDWDSALFSQMLSEGHAIGNRLWQESGNLASDQSTPSQLAEQYLKTEKKIRALIQSSNQDAAAAYTAQAKLYRRPGGDNAIGSFLDPTNYDTLTHEPFLKSYVDVIDWLKTVYDYSGWGVTAGDEVTSKTTKGRSSFSLSRRIVSGGKDVAGVAAFLCVASNHKRALQASQGVIVQMYDGDKLTPQALSQIILQLRVKGAEFHVLPRTDDKANTLTIGADDPPTADDNGIACT